MKKHDLLGFMVPFTAENDVLLAEAFISATETDPKYARVDHNSENTANEPFWSRCNLSDHIHLYHTRKKVMKDVAFALRELADNVDKMLDNPDAYREVSGMVNAEGDIHISSLLVADLAYLTATDI